MPSTYESMGKLHAYADVKDWIAERKKEYFPSLGVSFDAYCILHSILNKK